MNVGSGQVQEIRRMLNKKSSVLVIGKNTLIRRVLITRYQELEKNHPYHEDLSKFGPAIKELEALKNWVEGKVGFIFTNVPVFELKPIIEANKQETAARVGTIAPIDVIIPPGPTGMDPSQISFFHALQIPTKIEKQQIQITKDFQVCFKGSKVTNS
jgi:large subunit ribosomal protein LP0